MKTRNLLMTLVFMIAVTASFGSKMTAKPPGVVSVYLNGTCVNIIDDPDQAYCMPNYTGPQCTVNGVRLAYEFEATTTPTCSIPLRQLF